MGGKGYNILGGLSKPSQLLPRRAGDHRDRLPKCLLAGACATEPATQPQLWDRLGRHCPGCRLTKCFR